MSESESASHCRKNGEGQQIKMNKKMKFVRINTISWPFPLRAGETRGKTEADKSNPFYYAHKNEEQKTFDFYQFHSMSKRTNIFINENCTVEKVSVRSLRRGLRENEIWL